MTPKYISVSARAASSQLLGKSEIEMDLFDAIIRRIKQDDDVLYSSVANLRWRHFFESDLMALITAGALDLTESKLREQLVGSYIPYDLTKCKLLFFPTLLQQRWVCYAWRLHDNVISVFDPSYGVPVPDSRVDTHERVCYMPKIAMHTVVGKMFHGWQYAWTSAAMQILSWSDTALAGWNRTGLLCSLFLLLF